MNRLLLSLVLIMAFALPACSSNNSSSTSSDMSVSTLSSSSSKSETSNSATTVSWTKNSEANKFIASYNNEYPDSSIVESDVEAYTNGAGNAALVTIDDIICEFTYSDGDPTLTIFSDLPLDSSGRSVYFDQTAKAIAVKYDLPLSTAETIMTAFDSGEARQIGDGDEYKSYDSNGIMFVLQTNDIHHNYDLFTMKR